MAENTGNTDWNEDGPDNDEYVRRVPQEIRVLRGAVRTALEREHFTIENSDSLHAHALDHKQGSARVYLQSGYPSVQPDGSTNLSIDPASAYDKGRLAVDTAQSNLLKVYVDTSAGISSGWQRVMIGGFKLVESGLCGGHPLVDIASGTQSGQAIHVGQIDTRASTGQLKIIEPATGAMFAVAVLDPPTEDGHVAGKKYVDALVATIVTGTIAHGQTISLPDGYTAVQCKWSVSINSLKSSCTIDSHGSYVQHCSVDANRVVTCKGTCGTCGDTGGTANYIIIGSK